MRKIGVDAGSKKRVRKKNSWSKGKKATAVLASLALLAGGVAPGLVAASEEKYDNTYGVVAREVMSASNIRTADGLAPDNDFWSTDKGHKIYFGKYDIDGNFEPTLYRVLDVNHKAGKEGTQFIEEEAILLESDSVLYQGEFDSNNRYVWNDTDLSEELNGSKFYNKEGVLTSEEKSTIISTTVLEEADYSVTSNILHPLTTNQYKDNFSTALINIISAKEYSNYYEERYDGIKKNSLNIAYYWLRSQAIVNNVSSNMGLATVEGSKDNISSNNNLKDDIYNGYLIFTPTTSRGETGVVPLFNIRYSDLTYAVPTNFNKKAYASLQSAPTYTGGTDWEIALVAGGETEILRVMTHDEEVIRKPGEVITIDVSEVGAPEDGVEWEQLTGIIYNSDGMVMGYGKVGEALEQQLAITIPNNIPIGNYQLKVFAEDFTDGVTADLTSAPGVIEFEVGFELEVDNDPTETMLTRVSYSGAEYQWTSNPIDKITYTVDPDYYLPFDYANITTTANTALTGISVNRLSYTQFEITGTALADIFMEIQPATEKADNTQEMRAVGDDKQILYTDDSMEYSTSPNGPWTTASVGSTVAAAGDYYIRYKTTDTVKAGEPKLVTVFESYSVLINNDESINHIAKQSGGDLSQQIRNGESMVTVVMTVVGDYYFPWNYTVETSNGIWVTRDSETQITIFGSPTGDVEIDLIPATAKGNLPTPVVYGGILNIQGTSTNMEYTTDVDSGVWLDCTDNKTDVVAGTYYVRYKGDSQFSPSAAVTVTVTDAVTVTINVVDDANLTYIEGTGDETQTNLTGIMIPVSYSADENYFFPVDYEYQIQPSDSGISVTRNNAGQITVSGTPNASTIVTLLTSSNIATQREPVVTGGRGEILGTTDDMVYAMSPDASVWFPCEDGQTPAGGGTWYVKYPAKEGFFESPCTEVTVTGASIDLEVIYPANYGIDWDNTSGAAQQTGVTGNITEIRFTAQAGYYFPEDYETSTHNGVVVERISETEIRVYGSPAINMSITLTPATQKTSDELGYDVVIKNPEGSNLNWSDESGKQTQTGLTEDMVEVIYKAENGYYFPSTYYVAGTNNISVSVVQGTDDELRVYGTPSAHTTIELKPAVLRPVLSANSVTIINPAGSNITIANNTGDINQGNLLGAMEEVVFNANTGYYFPDTYKIASVGGITVTRNSDTQITVSGFPTTDVAITLIAASVKLDGNDVVITNPEGTGLKCVAGSDEQYDLLGAMKEVIYQVEDGYYIPDTYEKLGTTDGITVTKTSDYQLSITGTPTTDVNIVLSAATSDDRDTSIGYSVSVTNPSGSNIMYVSGDVGQVEITGNMTDVEFKAASGYYFPEGYGQNINGVNVVRVDESTIVVTGAPSGDTVLTLEPARKKDSDYVPDERGVYVKIFASSSNGFTLTTGSASQTEIEGDMESVTYTASNGYYFPEDYTDGIAELNGVKVERIGSTVIKVWGTPTADTILVLPAATSTDPVDPDEPDKPETTYVEVQVINDNTNGIKWNSDYGNQTQTVSGTMTDIVYEAINGYYFPEDYTVASITGPDNGITTTSVVDTYNGVSVIRVDESMIVVTGKPTGAVVVTLNAAEIKEESNEEEAGFKVSIYKEEPSYFKLVSGSEYQTGIEGDMTTVYFEANEGYYFPVDYKVDGMNGVTVTRVTETSIKVSGTPTADAWVRLLAATKIDEEDTEEPEKEPEIELPNLEDLEVDVDTDGDGEPDINIDTDGDGLPDTNIDLDGDGIPDINIDTDGDGEADLNVDTDGDLIPDLNVDTDGDGEADLNIDTDGDGEADLNIDTDGDGEADLNVDTDGDGEADLNIDTDGDGEADLNIDTNGDGEADLNIDTDGDGEADLNVDTNGDGKPDTNLDADGDGVVDDEDETTGGTGNIPGSTTGSTSSNVKTGDDTSVFVYILGVLLSVGTILILSRKKYR